MWSAAFDPDLAKAFLYWAKRPCAAPAAGQGGPGLFVEPVALALFLVKAGLFAPLLEPKVEVDAGAVAWEGADKGFAAEVADEAVDFAGLRGGERVLRFQFAGESR